MRIPAAGSRAIDVIGFGEASIDEVWRLPPGLELGEKGRAEARERIGGGQIATALVACVRLGASARYLGPIGDDEVGEEIVRGLLDEGVSVADGARIPGARSRTALVLVERGGERTVVEDGGAEARVDDDALATVTRARALHLDGTRPFAALALARAARQADTLVSIDVDAVPADPSAAEAIRALVELADVCVLPQGFATKLTGVASPAAALRKLAAHGPSSALHVETRGADGAFALVGRDAFAVSTFPIDVVDTTACGDTFRAALLCALLDGRGERDALRFASAAAALKCRAIGRRGCPTRADVEALLAR